MSDQDRKFYGKKRFSNNRFENNKSFGSRCFNNNSAYGKEKESKDGASKDKNVKQPTILLKAPERVEERSASPKQKENEPSGSQSSQITIASSPNSVSSTTTTISTHEGRDVYSTVKHMTKCMKLLDDGTLYSENINEYLLENNDFLVVGFIGCEGVGKSTLLNLLTTKRVTTREIKEAFSIKDKSVDENVDNLKILSEDVVREQKSSKEKFTQIFKQQTNETIEANVNTTHGIDMYITENRMILLDCQPLMSSAILDELMRNENKRGNVISEFLPLENSGEIQSLQLTAFMMSVCHVLVVVNNWFFDSNLIRFLQTAEMLKPTISNPEEEFNDYFPHLVLFQNKAQMQDFTPRTFKKLQQIYKTTFNNSKMHLESGLGLGTGRIINSLSPEITGPPINLFLLPDYNEKTRNCKILPPVEEFIYKFRAALLGANKYPLTHVQLTEKNWLVYSQKVWDHVKKSSFFVEYTKLMP